MKLGLHAPQLAAVRDLRERSGRLRHGRYVVEGRTTIDEALAAGLEPEAVYATEEAVASWRGAAPVFVIPDRAMARLSTLDTPPGLLAVFPMALCGIEPMLATGRPAVILAGITDPGNAGTLVRAAEIFGCAGAIFTRGSVDPHNPKLVRASMGAFFRMIVAEAEGTSVAPAAHAAGYIVVGAARGGEPLAGASVPPRYAVAVGSERHGIDPTLACDRLVEIEHLGAGESLNAAVAGSIVLYAFSRRGEA